MSDPSQVAADPSLTLAPGPQFFNPAYATPNQKIALYTYANELLKPQQVKNGWQGLASIANALIGGYAGYKADQMEQQSRAADQGAMLSNPGVAAPPPGAAPVSGSAPPVASAPPVNPQGAGDPLAAASAIPVPASLGGGAPANVAAAPPTSVSSYVAQAAAARGIDPAIATKMLIGESGAQPGAVGDDGSSFGPLQLHYGNVSAKYPHPGLGDAFTAKTGLDARDPKTWTQQVDFALDQAKEQGWAPWATTRDKLGLSNTAGIGTVDPAWAKVQADAAEGNKFIAAQEAKNAAASGFGGPVARAADGSTIPTDAQGRAIDPASGQPTMAYAPTSPIKAMGAALIGAGGSAPQSPVSPAGAPPQGVRTAQNGPALPLSPSQLAYIAANPNATPEQRAFAMHLMQPQTVTDVTGNVRPIMQGSAMGAPIGNVGTVGPGSNVNGVGLSTIVTGTPTAPHVSTIGPGFVDGGTGGNAPPSPPPPGPNPGAAPQSLGDKIFAPTSPVGSLIAAGQAAAARGAATTSVAGGAADQYVKDMQGAINYQRSALPLAKAIPALEALGTQGTGPGTETWNEVMSFLQSSGLPGIDTTKIKNFDEAKKYLTDFVNQNGDHGTNDRLAASFAGNPSTGISNAAAVDVAKTAATMQRFKQAQVMSFGGATDPTTGQPMSKDKYLDYAANFQSKYDPRAFGIDMMSPASIAALDKEMPVGTEARAKFNASLKIAKELGLVTK